MIAALASVYLAIGVVLALVAARRRARGVELLALVTTWPLYAPLWLERPHPGGLLDTRLHALEAALDRVGTLDGTEVTAADAVAWLARHGRARAALAALERALAAHQHDAADDSPVLARARAERQRRQAALATVEHLLGELEVQIGLARWVAGADDELRRLLSALAAQLALADPRGDV